MSEIVNEAMINIPGRVHSVATNHIVSGANEIYDDDKGKRQSEINAEQDTLNGKIPIYTQITWSDLKALRDNSQLVPGTFYRITDYTCTTTQENTQSAGHVFDIIVCADATNVLNENAYAAKHAGDTYFDNSKLEAWKLCYCIDNDTNRFTWADATNGKGVIYRMIDEFNNDVSYDFKNIQFKRWKATDAKSRNGISNEYLVATTVNQPEGISVSNSSVFIWAYTFSSTVTNDEVTDFSITNNNIFGNVIKKDKDNILTNNVFYGGNIYNNVLQNNCKNNTFGRTAYNNTLDFGCCDNIFALYNQNNNFGKECSKNVLDTSACCNKFENNCINNSLGVACRSNVFGISCTYNSLKNYNSNNTFKNNCSHIISNITYFYDNIIESGNEYITITSTENTDSSHLLRNIKICQGCNNTSTVKTISHNTLNDVFLTEYKPANSQIISV